MAELSRRDAASRFRLNPTTAAIMMAFAAPSAYAQNTEEESLPEVEVTSTTDKGEGFRTDETSAATRTLTPLRDIPQTIQIIPQEVIRSQGATTLQDALRNVPGITYGAAEGGNLSNQVLIMRGDFALSALYLDGVRDIGEYNRDLFAIESVEVLKGAAGLMFGRGTPNGVINQTSKYAHFTPDKEISFTFGSFETKRAVVDLNMPMSETASFRLAALYEDSGSYRYPQDVKKVGVAPSLVIRANEDLDISMQYYYLHTQDVTDYGQPVMINNGIGFYGLPPVSARTYYGFANYDETRHDTNIATIRVDYRFNDVLSLHNTTRFASYKRDMEATIPSLTAGQTIGPATDPGALTVTRQHNKARDNDDTVAINQTEVTWKVETGAVKHTLLGGLELSKEKLDRQNYTFGGTFKDTNQPYLSPDPYTTLNYTKVPNTNPTAEATSVSVYVQDQMEFTPQWKLLLGTRWENYDTDVATYNLDGSTNSGPFSKGENLWSYRGGLIWQPSTRQSYYVSYGNAYEPSGTIGVYSGTGSDLDASTLNIDPEKTIAYEVGGQWDVLAGTQIRWALFRSDKTNERVDADPATGGNQWALIGERRIQGLELEAAGRVTPNWDVFASYAFTDSEIIKGAPGIATPLDGNAMMIPKNAGSVWTIYRLGGGWEVGGGAFYASEMEATLNGTTGELPSYVRWDATVAYVQKKYSVRLNLDNITDELYYVAAYQNSGNRVVPAMPRAAFVTLSYNFD
jgi:catecholate siderophore receptor